MSEEIKTEEAGTDNNQEEKKQKKSIVTSFMDGAKEGFYIGIENILPAMVLGYVIIRFLELTGLVNLIGKVFAPVMGIFGLPGEAAIVLMSAFFAKAAGAATAANLYADGNVSRTLCKNCSCSRDKSEIQVASFGAADSSQPGGNAWDARNHDAYGVYVSCFISVNGAAGFD